MRSAIYMTKSISEKRPYRQNQNGFGTIDTCLLPSHAQQWFGYGTSDAKCLTPLTQEQPWIASSVCLNQPFIIQCHDANHMYSGNP